MEVNREIKGNAELDKVDHALGRPHRAHKTKRDHYATDCNVEISNMSRSPWWRNGGKMYGMTFFHVSDIGREALAKEISNVDKYGRLYQISSPYYSGSKLINAQSPSQAKYHAWLDADIDWSFIEYARNISVRLAR